MLKWAKIANEETKECSVGLGTDESFYSSIGMTQMDVEQCSWNGRWYLIGYCPAQPEPSKEEKILALEKQITDRNIRSAFLGDEYALNKIRDIEAQIAALRAQEEAQ
jgi:hypothetical protein